MTDWILRLIAEQGPSTGLILLTIWYGLKGLREDVNAVKSRMDCFEKSQHACQLDVAKDYVTKAELRRESDRLDAHETRLSKLEGRQ